MKDDPRRHSAAAYPWSLSIATRFSDMDPNRHLNNVAVSRLFEEGRVRFHMGLRETNPEIGHPHFLVAYVAIDYLAEGTYPADTELRLAISQVGNSSYRIAKALFQNGKAFALADSVLVHRAANAPGSAPMPEVLKSALKGYSLA